MMKTNRIGLDAVKAKKLAELLNVLLANYQLFYINSRGFHWNIKGEKFFELHIKFEELYTDTQLKIDEIAERILTLEHTPNHTFTDFLKLSKIKEQKNVTDGVKAVNAVLSSFGVLLDIERQLLTLSAEANDEGTNALMSDYIRQQEKLVWMYSAYLSK
ncbi:MAG: DNA starvation/stationary phase protection protein [Chitinophagaceae bacterium]|nr:DNA starvation/stationary phase protection protein [Chitinophagaceae bacterium]